MRIKDLERILYELTEAPGVNKGKEIIFGQLISPKLMDLLTIGAALDCIWEEFEEKWEEEGKSLMADLNNEVFEALSSITKEFFSYIFRENPSSFEILKEAEREQEIILKAIEEAKMRTLKAGNS